MTLTDQQAAEQADYAARLVQQIKQLDIVKWQLRQLLVLYQAKGYAGTPEGFDLPTNNITAEKISGAIAALTALDTAIQASGNEDALAALV